MFVLGCLSLVVGVGFSCDVWLLLCSRVMEYMLCMWCVVVFVGELWHG